MQQKFYSRRCEKQYIMCDSDLTQCIYTINHTPKHGSFEFSFGVNYHPDERIFDNFLLAIKNNTSIEKLKLLNISYKKIALIAEIIGSHPSINRFDFSGNMGPDGPEHFAKMIINNKKLKYLRLSAGLYGSGIDYTNGGQVFCDALAQNNTLITLNLRLNRMGGVDLGRALETNTTLTSLNLSANHISLEDANALITSLNKNNTLQTLDLSLNNLNMDVNVLNLLEKNRTLTTLKVFEGAYIDASQATDTVLCGMLDKYSMHSENTISQEDYRTMNQIMERNLSLLKWAIFPKFMIFQSLATKCTPDFSLDVCKYIFDFILRSCEKNILEIELSNILNELEQTPLEESLCLKIS